jgi:hypothetical protein
VALAAVPGLFDTAAGAGVCVLPEAAAGGALGDTGAGGAADVEGIGVGGVEVGGVDTTAADSALLEGGVACNGAVRAGPLLRSIV